VSTALVVTWTEQEAHELLQRHLHRSLAGSRAVILQRNNSANRLPAATAFAVNPDLVSRLDSAQPRSCMAVRFASPHQEGPAFDPLLACGRCSARDVTSSANPCASAAR
jgi:hypothetical protein